MASLYKVTTKTQIGKLPKGAFCIVMDSSNLPKTI